METTMPHSELFCKNWCFCPGFEQAWVDELQSGEPVVLPHNAVDLPLDYFDETSYQRKFTYQNTIDWKDDFVGQEIWLRFDGAMANSHVYLNGVLLGRHPDGYTPFRMRLTDNLTQGINLVTVVVDGYENPEIPPFGGQIDYLTYAGIYREVWLEHADPISISNIKIETPNPLAKNKSVHVCTFLENSGDLPVDGECRVTLRDVVGDIIGETCAALSSGGAMLCIEELSDIALWSLDTPVFSATMVLPGVQPMSGASA